MSACSHPRAARCAPTPDQHAPPCHPADAKGIIRHHGHPMEPKFASVLDTVCKEAAAAGGGAAPEPAAPSAEQQQPRQQRELPPVTASREELMARPVRELKQILQERGIRCARRGGGVCAHCRRRGAAAAVHHLVCAPPYQDPHTLASS